MTITRPRLFLLLTLVCALSPVARTFAQEHDGPLSTLLPELILGSLSASDPNNPSVALVQSLNAQFGAQLSSFPLGSSTGGLTYTFDSTLGTFRRGSATFGPAFAERALTIGRRRLSAGVNYQHSSYDSFEGLPLDDGSVTFYLRQPACCIVAPIGPPAAGTVTSPFVSLIKAALSLDARTDTLLLFANYGLSERWDIGVAVPFVHVALDADVVATIPRLVPTADPNVLTLEAPDPNAPPTHIRREGSATGIGDVLLRTKYRLFDVSGGGLGVGADMRLPTGNREELLSAGGQARIYLVVSAGQGRFSQHVNIGYTFAMSDLPDLAFPGGPVSPVPDELGYAAGVEFMATPRLTLLGDLVGRSLRDAGRLSLVTKTLPFEFPGVPATPPRTASYEELESQPGHLNLMLGAFGAKANVWGDLLVSAHVLVPFTDAGLKSRWTLVLGVDFAF